MVTESRPSTGLGTERFVGASPVSTIDLMYTSSSGRKPSQSRCGFVRIRCGSSEEERRASGSERTKVAGTGGVRGAGATCRDQILHLQYPCTQSVNIAKPG
jgi:hypothetical protein